MKRMRFNVVFTALLLAIIANTTALPVHADQVVEICAGSSIPSGYVRVGVGTNSGCGGGRSWFIQKAKDGLEICAGSPFPSGYVVTGFNPNGGCRLEGIKIISKPKDNLEVCASSPIPSGYVVTGFNPNGGCHLDGIKIIAKPKDNLKICAFSPIPSDYVVTGFNPNGDGCGLLGIKIIAKPKDNLKICAFSPIPSGYVATDFNPNGDGCGLLGTKIIYKLKSDRRVAFTVSFTDPVNDQTGRAVWDVTGMVMTWNSATGDYVITLTTTPSNPFIGQFRVNVNLFNPDTNESDSFFEAGVNDFDLATPTTVIVLNGVSPALTAWRLGERVASSTLAGLGNPPGISLFRCSVLALPPGGFLTDEDAIAYESNNIANVSAP